MLVLTWKRVLLLKRIGGNHFFENCFSRLLRYISQRSNDPIILIKLSELASSFLITFMKIKNTIISFICKLKAFLKHFFPITGRSFLILWIMIVFCTYDIKNSPIYTKYTHTKLNISDPKEYFQFRSLSHNPFSPFLCIYSSLKKHIQNTHNKDRQTTRLPW